MGKIREYQFVTGIETSTIPDPATPSADSDTVSLGYLNDLSYWAEPVASYAAVRALDDEQRVDNQRRVVDGTQEIWYFDAASTASDDGATILKPTDLGALDPGRWLIQPGGSGGGGGGGSGIEQLLQKLEAEKSGVFTEALDNSVGISAAIPSKTKDIIGYLLEGYTSSGTSASVVWDPKVINEADINMDSTTGWSAGGAGNNLTATSTSGEFKIGTAALKFDKNSSSTDAHILYSRSAADLYVASHTEKFVFVYLPSITDLSNVYCTVYSDTGTNGKKFTTTTNAEGGALAVGWNRLKFDLTSAGSAEGSGWTSIEGIRTEKLGVTTGLLTQTYTGLIFDSSCYSLKSPNTLPVIGNEFTVYDSSNKEDLLIRDTSTRSSGLLTVGAVGSTFSGGFTGSGVARIVRSSMVISGQNQIDMDNSGLSGEIGLEQEVRVSKALREDVNGNVQVTVDVLAVQGYEVTAVGGSTIDVSDSADDSLNLLNTNVMDIFRPIYDDSGVSYTPLFSRSLTANASHSSGTTTLTLTTTSIQVGDVVCKRHLSSAALSVVASTDEETFGALSLETTPDGFQLLGEGVPYPNKSSIWGHWFLGDIKDSGAIKHRFGTNSNDFTVNGNPDLQGQFQKGRFSAKGFTNTDYLSIGSTESQSISGNSPDANMVQISCWILCTSTPASINTFICKDPSNGYLMAVNTSGQIQFNTNGGSVFTSGAISMNKWHHVVFELIDFNLGPQSFAWVDGVKSSGFNATIGAASGAFQVGTNTVGSNPATNVSIADLIIWRNGTLFTSDQVASIYNRGFFRPVGTTGLVQRYNYSPTSSFGQKMAIKIRLNRSTSAVRPVIYKAGAIYV